MDSSPDKECEHKTLSSPLVAFSHLNSFCRGTRKWILIELLGDAPSSLGHGAGAHQTQSHNQIMRAIVESSSFVV